MTHPAKWLYPSLIYCSVLLMFLSRKVRKLCCSHLIYCFNRQNEVVTNSNSLCVIIIHESWVACYWSNTYNSSTVRMSQPSLLLVCMFINITLHANLLNLQLPTPLKITGTNSTIPPLQHTCGRHGTFCTAKILTFHLESKIDILIC